MAILSIGHVSYRRGFIFQFERFLKQLSLFLEECIDIYIRDKFERRYTLEVHRDQTMHLIGSERSSEMTSNQKHNSDTAKLEKRHRETGHSSLLGYGEEINMGQSGTPDDLIIEQHSLARKTFFERQGDKETHSSVYREKYKHRERDESHVVSNSHSLSTLG